VTQAYLDRTDAYDRLGPYLNSLITVNRRALEVADRLDSELRTRGNLSCPRHGIPIIVKDNLDTCDLTRRRASRCSGTSSHRAMP
jgi:amidase